MNKRRGTAARLFWAVLLFGILLMPQTAACAKEEEGQAAILPGGKDSYQLLLVGSDRRDDTWNGNSDVMILVTIQSETQEIIMTSFMRDLCAQIPGHGTAKLNHAFAVGGAELLKETLEENYQLSIDNYMIVDFESMAEIVDSVGGVQMTVSDDESVILNQYLESMGASEYSLQTGGDYLLNGYQTVAYMRIRYVGNGDYERTQRQRDVLDAIFTQVQELDAQELLALAPDLLTQIEHDIDPLSLLELTASIPAFTGYELKENRIPYDGLYTSQNEMLVPELPETVERLHELIDGNAE